MMSYNKLNMKYFYKGFFWGIILFFSTIMLLYVYYPLYFKVGSEWGYLMDKGVSKSKWISGKYYNNLIDKNKILLFGTSETGGLATRPIEPNYWKLLNEHLQNSPIVTTGGAGNTPFMWMNILCSLPKGAKIYYLVNPIYFTQGLNTKDSVQSYARRYLSDELLLKTYSCLKSILDDSSFSKDWNDIFDSIKLSNITLKENISFFIKEFYDSFNKIEPKEKVEAGNKITIGTMDRDYNEKYNVAEWILKERDYSGLGSTKISNDIFNSVRYKELQWLVAIAKSRNIELTLILMPPNYQLYAAYKSSYPTEYKQMFNQMKQEFCNSNIHCIDINNEVYSKGLFVDAMHFSAYGARVVANKLLTEFH